MADAFTSLEEIVTATNELTTALLGDRAALIETFNARMDATVGAKGDKGDDGISGTTNHTQLTNVGTRTHEQLESDIELKLDKINPELSTLVFTKDSGDGIKIINSEQEIYYPWHDKEGAISADIGAQQAPLFSLYRGGLRAFKFQIDDQVYLNIHMPHDYVKGTDVFLHEHWSHNSNAVIAGGTAWGAEVSYSKGHNQEPFCEPINIVMQEDASVVRYQHMVTESQLSSIGGIGGLIKTEDLEPDGMLLIRTHLISNSITPYTAPFLHQCDLHYQSTGIGTIDKTPNFYEKVV